MLTTIISSSTNITVTSKPTVGSGLHIQNPVAPTFKALSKSAKLDDALRLIESSPSKFEAVESDIDSCCTFLHTCIRRKSIEHGQRLYLHLLLSRDRGNHSNLLNNPILKSKFITLFSVCGRIDEARRVFEDGLKTQHVDESLWVAMAIAYTRNGYPKEALLLYVEMLCRFIRPSKFAFSMALKACSNISNLLLGRSIHAQIVKSQEEPDQVVNNALLKLYTDGCCSNDVLKIFGKMHERNIVSWNSMLAFFLRQDQVFKSLECFRNMQEGKMGFNWVTLTTILPVCARLTALNSGKEIHAQIIKSPSRPDTPVLNSLMDMYAKCGLIHYCRKVFSSMHRCVDLTSWNTLLNGYAINGHINEALELFDDIVSFGLTPDGITFIVLLSGCSHGGLTHEGQRLFNRMKTEFGVSPTLEHYACLVDILGRAGKLEEALEVVKSMPMKPSGSIWGSLLNSCRLYGNVALGEAIAKILFVLEPGNAGNYVMLSNIYAKEGNWEGVWMVREMMQNKRIKKEAGCSWIQIRDKIHTFLAGGGFEFRESDEYKKVWEELMVAMEKAGYAPDTDVVLHDVKEEMKRDWVRGHSERLATIYGIIHVGRGLPIRITKNLRVCKDCHSWLSVISRVTKRVIVLRDTNRFHHFDGGACSCNDYW